MSRKCILLSFALSLFCFVPLLTVIFCCRWESGKWKRLSRSVPALGRMMHVNPSLRNRELYHLRLLLLHIRGPTSFLQLLTVDGKQYKTFRDACEALGVTRADFPKHDMALKEVLKHASPWQFRNFFVNLMVHCNLDNINKYWIQYRSAMADDYRKKGVENALLRARSDVLRQVESMDLTCCTEVAKELTLPSGTDGEEAIPVGDISCSDADLNDFDSQVDDPAIPPLQVHLAALTPEQSRVHSCIMDSVLNSNYQVPNIFSLMAPAGTGKTHVYKGLINDCKARGIPFVATAYTAIAALLLPDGETCHRAFGIPIRGRTDGNERSFIEAMSNEGVQLCSARLIVIDECSMLSKWQVILIDHLFRMLHGVREVPFGGRTVLFGGDMAQILPVRNSACSGDVTDHCVTSWEHWHARYPLTLTKNMRAAEDTAFADWVSHVRDGTANFKGTDRIYIPEKLLVKPVLDPGRAYYKTAKDGNTRDEDALMDGIIQRVSPTALNFYSVK